MYGLLDTLVSFLGVSLNWNAPSTSDAVGPIIPWETEVWIHDLRQRWGVNGLSAVVVTSPEYQFGNRAWNEQIISSGTADGSREVTPETVWALPSSSKFLTTLALAQLIDSNVTLPNGEQLEWGTTMEAVYPGCSQERMDGWGGGLEWGKCNITLSGLGIERGNGRPRDNQFAMISHVVKLVSGMSYIDYVTQHILTPMGLAHAFSKPGSKRHNRADGFMRVGVDVAQCAKDIQKDEPEWQTIDHASCLGTAQNVGWWTERYRNWGKREDEWFAGTAGLELSSVESTRLLRSVLNSSTDVPRLVSLDPWYQYAKWWRNQSDSQGGVSFGFGTFFPQYHEGKLMVAHLGTMGGQTSMMTWMPHQGFAIMLTMNEGYYANELPEMIAFHLVDELLRTDGRKWTWEPSIVWSYGRDGRGELGKYPDPPALPSLPIIKMEDTYIHDDLRRLTLRPISPEGAVPDQSDEDLLIMRTLKAQTHLPLNHDGPMYISATHERIIFDKILFTHWDADQWNWTAINIYNSGGNPASDMKTPVVDIVGTGQAEAVEEGIRMHGGWWSGRPDEYERHGDRGYELKGHDSFARRWNPEVTEQ